MNLFNQTPDDALRQLDAWLAGKGPGYRVRQVLPRIWNTPVGSWSDATELPAALRDQLHEAFPVPRLSLVTRQVSKDGTVKFLWGLPDGATIESVLIPERKRRTLCISSQVGCAFGCVFCATGRMGFGRNLETWEIVGQVRELALDPEYGPPTNVVFMGMGEPLHNWDAVDRALTILNDPIGFGIGARHITVSTVGLVPELAKLAARREQFRLALSLHSPDSKRRREIMPVEKKYDLDQVMTALKAFARRVTFEYVMIKGVNDRPEDAKLLAARAGALGALVNILPLHPGGADGLTPTSMKDIKTFADSLEAAGISATIRRSRGLDIDAACGQLRTATLKRQRGEIPPNEDGGIEQEARIEVN